MDATGDPLQALARYLAGEEEVLLAYLFGSRAVGTAGPRSDYDIALLVRNPSLDLRTKPLDEFFQDVYLRDIVERNMEIAIQRCIDMTSRIISLEEAPRPRDSYESILRLGELGVLPTDFARQLATVAGFGSVLGQLG